MRRILGALGALLVVVAVVAFGRMEWIARSQEDAQPVAGFDLFAFFDGESVSEGRIETIAGGSEAFSARFRGQGSDDRLLLEERFTFPDGERLQRWDLRRTAAGVIEGHVETELKDGALAEPAAVRGSQGGGVTILLYRGVAPGGSGVLLRFRHEMRPQPDGTVSNHVVVRKAGLPLAVSTVTFAKAAPDADRGPSSTISLSPQGR